MMLLYYNVCHCANIRYLYHFYISKCNISNPIITYQIHFQITSYGSIRLHLNRAYFAKKIKDKRRISVMYFIKSPIYPYTSDSNVIYINISSSTHVRIYRNM